MIQRYVSGTKKQLYLLEQDSSEMTDFSEKSHERHRDHYKEHIEEDEPREDIKKWLRDDTVEEWRHDRLHKLIDPILDVESNSRWLTVGDGRFAREARYISDHGHEALPTDISVELLAEAKERGYIDDYAEENAEELSFDDSTFDYVFCKQSYHHFPRPYLALYEMLRVAKNGVVLIEPSDPELHENIRSEPMLRKILNVLKRLHGDGGRVPEPPIFEPSGNYVFTISRREIEKIALGLDYDAVAFKGINDFLNVEGAAEETLAERGPIYRKMKVMTAIRDILCRAGLVGHSKLAAILFKRVPDDKIITELSDSGYDVIQLPDNPHIDRS